MRADRHVPTTGRAPVDLRATWGVMRRGGGDPTWAEASDGLWKAWRTPEGPVTVHVVSDRDGVHARAWGPGRARILDALPTMLGEDDDPVGFHPRHDRVAAARSRYPGWRVPRTALVLEALVPSIIEQRVTGAEAFASYRRLVRRFGEPAPGPGADLGLVVAPDAAGWARIPSWEWIRAGVESARADTAVRAARVAGRLEEAARLPLPEARRRLAAVPGVGPWTVAEVAHVALGDADAVSFGDYHVARDIGWALVGHELDDAGLARLLEPYAGHRYRVQRLLELDGARRPRRGARRTLPTHLPARFGPVRRSRSLTGPAAAVRPR